MNSAAQSTRPIGVASSLLIPKELKRRQALSDTGAESVVRGRMQIRAILRREDPRYVVVIGPCSVHDPVAFREYAQSLLGPANECADTFLIALRVYGEKPRTGYGWKGFVNDPDLCGRPDIARGLAQFRDLGIEAAEMGLPLATEMLSPNLRPYCDDLFSWYAIGARTTESQLHREEASGLPTVVGFKNGTSGDVEVAVNAMLAAERSHSYVGPGDDGRAAVIATSGNSDTHIVLRGGGQPNYDRESVATAEELMRKRGLRPAIMIDCSHGNSGKQADRQLEVLEEGVKQIEAGSESIFGFMLESFLVDGSQPLSDNRAKLEYGKLITDPCIGWEKTELALSRLRDRLRPIVARNAGLSGSHEEQMA